MMTRNQIAYHEAKETARANRMREGENFRHNSATERETYRSNLADERENYRHNTTVENETERHNRISEKTDRRKANASMISSVGSALFGKQGAIGAASNSIKPKVTKIGF